jgi:thiol:disulfide interchange protein DsbC
LAKNNGNCDTPINDTIKLARDLGVTSTPTLILSSGKRLPGALSAEDLEKYLDGTYD